MSSSLPDGTAYQISTAHGGPYHISPPSRLPAPLNDHPLSIHFPTHHGGSNFYPMARCGNFWIRWGTRIIVIKRADPTSVG